jgi:hypothetical protein
MLQNIIVILIVASAIIYTIYATVRSLTKKKNDSACGGCSGCDIKKELLKNHPKDYTNICGGPK